MASVYDPLGLAIPLITLIIMATLCNMGAIILVHGQVTIIFVVSVCLSVYGSPM